MDTVYQPSDDSLMMLEVLVAVGAQSGTADRRPKTVLDMGTGSGILAIQAAKAGAKVTAVDINPRALKLARKNAKEAGVDIDFVLSDLFEKVKGTFDLIIFNPPYVKTGDSETVDMQSIAWDGGKDGMRVINRFLKRAKEFLRPSGRIFLLVSSNEDNPPEIKGYTAKVLKKKSLFFERLFVLELQIDE